MYHIPGRVVHKGDSITWYNVFRVLKGLMDSTFRVSSLWILIAVWYVDGIIGMSAPHCQMMAKEADDVERACRRTYFAFVMTLDRVVPLIISLHDFFVLPSGRASIPQRTPETNREVHRNARSMRPAAESHLKLHRPTFHPTLTFTLPVRAGLCTTFRL